MAMAIGQLAAGHLGALSGVRFGTKLIQPLIVVVSVALALPEPWPWLSEF
jgi:uncharacterized protein